jgi:energy-coupling factor transport system ATP-binding protein
MVSGSLGVLLMMMSFYHVHAVRDSWSLSATGTFREGVHLVSGDVGSGKSTLALMMAGFFPLSGGFIDKKEIQSSILSLQFPELSLTGLSVADECSSWGVDTNEILGAAGLKGRETTSPLSLSRGELKRLHLACVLARDGDLLLLDEPFSSLDCDEKAKLCDRIERKRTGITVIFTHEQNILPRVDRIWEISDGILIECGRPPDAFFTWRHIPAVVTRLIASGHTPENLSLKDLTEARCRIQE